MSNPEYIKVDNKLYKINTDFRVALECDRIARDNNIGDYERFLAIIYKLFGDDGLECKNQNKLLELGLKYITLGKEQKGLKNDFESKYQLDFNKCKGLIRSSFKFDYNYDPYNMEYLHWYDFYNDLENLSTSEFGTCCILNRIQSILNTDVKNIKDTKERTKINEAKILLKERYCIDEKVKMTKEQEKSAEKFYKALGLI